VLGYEFLVPNEVDQPTEELDLELLRRAVKVAARTRFREKRAAFDDRLERAVADGYTNEEAIADMRGLLADSNREVKRARDYDTPRSGVLVAGTGLTVGGHFFPPLWLGNVVLAPARYVASKVLPDRPFRNAPPAMFRETRNELCRRPLGQVTTAELWEVDHGFDPTLISAYGVDFDLAEASDAWGAETRSSCRGRVFVLVDEAAE
jgi:hypothetical protein